MRQPNFRKQIIEVANGLPIEAVVIGRKGWRYDQQHPRTGQVLPWDEAAPTLDYEYDDGYGGVECHAIYAWTAERVIFIGQYDGSSWVTYVPRHPIPCEPEMPGGS